MRGLRFLILAVAVGAGVGAVALVRSELDRAKRAQPVVVKQAKPKVAPRAQVLVAARELKMGELLKPEDLRWQSWPKDALSEFYVTKNKQPKARDEIEGVIVRSGLVAGEPVSDAKLIRLNKPSVMAAFLRKGMRGVSIKVSASSIAGGFVLPGDYVDVILTTKVEVEEESDRGTVKDKALISRTLLSSVRVLAVDVKFQPGGEANAGKARTATLEVTPEQAEVLALGEQAGTLRLALRSVAELIPETGRRPIEPRPELTFDPRTAPESDVEAPKNQVKTLRFSSKGVVTIE